jgi:hypothetical protein
VRSAPPRRRVLLLALLRERNSDPFQETANWQPLAQGNQSAIFGPGDGALYRLTPHEDLFRAILECTELLYQF